MGLKETQELYVRLAVDAGYREKLYSEQESSVHHFQDYYSELEKEARALLNKRRRIVQQMMPGTLQCLGSEFHFEFTAYSNSVNEPRGINRHRVDALEFAYWLERRTQDGLYPKALIDLLHHEMAPVRMWQERRRLLWNFHRKSPSRLLACLSEGKPLDQAKSLPALVVWRENRRAPSGYQWFELSLWK